MLTTSCRYFSVGGLLLWMCDKICRGVEASRLYTPSAVHWNERTAVVRLDLSRADLPNYHPGQFFFVNIPEISLNEWHPFTASAVLDTGIIFYIKRMGLKRRGTQTPTWSARLAELAMRGLDTFPKMRLSGPLGHTDFSKYDSLLLFAGGIGITPMISIFTDLLLRHRTGRGTGRVRSVVLIWMSRSVGEFLLFEEIISLMDPNSVPETKPHTIVEETDNSSGTAAKGGSDGGRAETAAVGCTFDLRLHCTRRDSVVSLTGPLSIDPVTMHLCSGRCDLREIFGQHGEGGPRTMSAVCGPPNLVQDVSRYAWRYGCDFHSEQFNF